MNRDSQLPQALPQTIEDAILVTQRLGYQYLWVDLLCIDQFDSSLKTRAIAAMDQIYSHAYLTICVINGSSMFSGIPGISRSLDLRYQIISDTETDRYMFNRFRWTELGFRDSDWAKRAWTFQKGQLSTRRLCFSEYHVFLVCKEEVFHDMVDLDESSIRIKCRFDSRYMHYIPFGFDLDMQSWNFDTYARMVCSYSRGSLTLSSDAYNAIAGAIQRLTKNLTICFVAALPTHGILRALLWLNHLSSFAPLYPAEEGRRRQSFPSWSWLGWEGRIEYWSWLQESHHLGAKQQSIFSFVDRNHGILYHDAVKVLFSALIEFESITPDASSSILRVTTRIAKFRTMETKKSQLGRLLIDHKCKIITETFIYNLEFGFGKSRECLVRLHLDTAKELNRMNVEELDFALLQLWAPHISERVPESLTGYIDDEMPECNPVFDDFVWAMALKRRPDNLCERLDVVSIPAKAWFSANPQPSVMRIA